MEKGKCIMNVYEVGSLSEKLSTNTYPGRGIVLGVTPDGSCIHYKGKIDCIFR